MKRKRLLELKKIVRQAGFHDAKRLGIWNDCEVFEAIFTDGKTHFVGFPQFIIVKGNDFRWSSGQAESRAIVAHFS